MNCNDEPSTPQYRTVNVAYLFNHNNVLLYYGMVAWFQNKFIEEERFVV